MTADATQAPMTWGRRTGYAVGDLGFNLYWQGVGLFLYFFYTDVMGIPPLWAGVAYAIASVWDGISDPIMGSIAERTQTRWGKFRPYLLLGALPCAGTFALSFWAPPLTGAMLMLYATLTHVALRTFYTVMNIPYIALTARMTSDADERSTLAGLRMVFAATGGLLVAFGVPQMVEWFGPNPHTAWFAAALVMAAAATVILTVCFFATSEPAAPADHIGVPPLQALREAFGAFGPDFLKFWRMLRSNGPLAQVFTSVCVTGIALTMFSKCLLYWLKYAVEKPELAKLILPIPAVALIGMAPVWAWASRRIGKRNVWLLGGLIAGTGYLAFFLSPSRSVLVTSALIVWVALGASAFAVMFWAMLPDTIEYNEWKLGARDEARVYGFAVFAQKVAVAANAIILGQTLEVLGFVANRPQTETTLWGIKAVMCLVPLAGVIVSSLVLWRYPITGAFHRKMRDEIASRTPPEPLIIP